MSQVLNGCARYVELPAIQIILTRTFRICPNGSKILLDWGLEPATRGKAAGMPGFSFLKCGFSLFAMFSLD